MALNIIRKCKSLKRPAVPQRIKALSWSLKSRVSGTINHVIYIYIWAHIFVYILHMCTHTHALHPLLSPNHAQSPAAEKVNWKECPKRSWLAWKDRDFLICRQRGRSVLGKRERSVTVHEAHASYKMILFLFCYWEGKKMGERRGSVWRKNFPYRSIGIAGFWVSRLWSLHGALLAEKMETPKINSIFIQLIKSSFGRNRHPLF